MSRRFFILLSLMLFTVTMGIGSTVAYLTAETNEIVNTLIPGTVPLSIQEEFDGTVKRNVRILNNGNTSAFIRVYMTVCWKDSSGNLAPELPKEGRDYTISWWDSGWQKEGEYYYCLTSIEPKQMTPVLIRELVQKKQKEGYHLVAEIVSQSIQSEGADEQGRRPIELAWNVTIQNGVLQPVLERKGDGQ